jgi:hypothetical protein
MPTNLLNIARTGCTFFSSARAGEMAGQGGFATTQLSMNDPYCWVAVKLPLNFVS